MAKPGSIAPPPAPPGKPGGLGQKVESTVERALHWLYATVAETTAGWVSWAFELFMHALRPGMLRVYGPFLRYYRDLPGAPPEVKSLIDGALNESGEAGAAALLSLGTQVGGAAIGSVTSSLFAPITHAVNRWIRPARPDPATAVAMMYRDVGSLEMIKDLLRDQGWKDDLINRFMSVLKVRIDLASSFAAEYRFGKSTSETDAEFVKRGYALDDVRALRDLSALMPGPGDLISMAVREAFDPAVVAAYGYDQNFPAEFGEWMSKQGDVDGWAMKFWAAHWHMPGLAQALEALYRLDDFGMDELDLFLRVSDIAPAWRDYIKRTAYRTLTRVDVRRMYGMGVLDRAGVKKKYTDFGYSPADAEAMTEFTVRYETDEDREATKTDILSFLNVGALTPEEAGSWLSSIGYGPELAAYLVTRELMKAERERVEELIKYYHSIYVHSEASAPTIIAELAGGNVPSGRITRLMRDWDRERSAKIERPSRATLDKLFRQDVIVQSEYISGLSALGYRTEYVNWYVTSILQEKAEDARKEEEATRKEQEEIRKRKVKSDYQIAKAALDVDVTELQTAIAETQLALRERQLRYLDELRVAREALTEAQLRRDAARDIAELESRIDDQQSAIAFLRETIDVLETEIAEIELKATPQPKSLTAGQAAVAIREREVEIEKLRGRIEGVETEIAALRLAAISEPVELTPDEAAVAIREREVTASELYVHIDALQTEIAAITLAASPEVAEITTDEARTLIADRRLAIEQTQDTIAALQVEVAELRLERTISVAAITPDEADVAIAERRVAIETLQDEIATFNVEIAEIERDRVMITTEIPPDVAEKQVGEHRLAIELAQDDIRSAQTTISDLRSQIHARRMLLEENLRIVERVRAIEEIEADWAIAQQTMTQRLSELRVNLAELREQKALLAVEYRSGLAEE